MILRLRIDVFTLPEACYRLLRQLKVFFLYYNLNPIPPSGSLESKVSLLFLIVVLAAHLHASPDFRCEIYPPFRISISKFILYVLSPLPVLFKFFFFFFV